MLSPSQDPVTRAVIERLLGEENEGELNCRLGSRMAFGTAGEALRVQSTGFGQYVCANVYCIMMLY